MAVRRGLHRSPRRDRMECATASSGSVRFTAYTGRALLCATSQRIAVGTRPRCTFSSPLGRAWSTALIIDTALGLGVRSEGGLSEIDHGDLAGLTNDEIEESHPGLLAERQSCLQSWRFPGGESYADGDLRAAAALSRIETTFTRRPVLVTHEMIARMLVRNLLELSVDEALNRSFTQGTVYQVTPMRGIQAIP